MYAVAKEHRSQKLFTKVRRAPLNIDKIDGPINNHKKDSLELNDICSSFNNENNSKTTKLYQFRSLSNHSNNHNHNIQDEEEITAQHQDMIRYINDRWQRIEQELDHCTKIDQQDENSPQKHSTAKNDSSVVKIKHINGSTTSSIPKNFVPFDLETFFGQRFIQKLLQST